MKTPSVLLPYQRRWVNDRSPFKMFVKSRRIGISWATAAEAVLEAARTVDEGGQHVWYVAQTEDDCAQFMRDAAMWARAFSLAAKAQAVELFDPKDKKASQVACLRFGSGFGIHALSRRPARLHGKEGYAILDEAALSEDPEGFHEAVGAYMVWGKGRVAIISTESGGTECKFHEWRRDNEAGRLDWSLHVTDIYHALAEGLYERVCFRNRWPIPEASNGAERLAAAQASEWYKDLKRKNGHHWRAQFECIPVGSGDVYFDRAAVQRVMSGEWPVIRFEPSTDFLEAPAPVQVAAMEAWTKSTLTPIVAAKTDHTRPHWLGADYGRSGDITAIYPVEHRLGDILRVPFAVELRNTPNDCQLVVFKSLIRGLPQFQRAAVDAGGQGSGVGEDLHREFGSTVLPIGIGAGRARDPDARPERSLYYSEMFPPVKARVDSKTCEIPDDPDTMADIMGVRNIDGMPKVPSVRSKGVTDGKQRHCDAAVGLALGIFVAEIGAGDWSTVDATSEMWGPAPSSYRNELLPPEQGGIDPHEVVDKWAM